MSDIDHLRKMEIKKNLIIEIKRLFNELEKLIENNQQEIKNSYLNDKKINIKNLFDER